MIKVTFLYPSKPGSRFNADYYIDVHMPLAIRLLGSALKAVSAEIGLPNYADIEPIVQISDLRIFQ
jgi:hypothetical protein